MNLHGVYTRRYELLVFFTPHRGTRFQVDRTARLEENQETFKQANERLEGIVAERLEGAQSVPFLCECADETCMGRIDLTLEDYRAVRARENHFVILVDHPRSPGEEVVAHRDGYDITEKPG